jgi:predicted AlkP superfamily phosphohydrolase/phosphomutase
VSNSDPSAVAYDTAHSLETRPIEIGIYAQPGHAPSQQISEEIEIELEREVGAPSEADEQLSTGGGASRRLLLIGLDGATTALALGAWRGDLRTLDLLAGRGVWGHIRSSIPWTSAPAWASLFSGLDPGQLGIYGPRLRINHSYAPPVAVDSHAIHDPRLWDILGEAGKHVGVVGASATTPAPAVHGHLIGDDLSSHKGPVTFPPSLRQQVVAWLGEAAPPVAPAGGLERLIQDTYLRAEQRFMLARRLLARDQYDCFVVMDDGIAAIQRALWDSFDSAHLRYQAKHPFAGTVGSFYRFVDDQLFELLELVDDDTIVAVVSAGGAQALHGELALNEWLIAEGELALMAAPREPAALEQCEVDWGRTRAWAGEAGVIYLNVAGREPLGTIPADQAEQVRARIAERLRALTTPDGLPALEVYRPETLYRATQGVAPDLIVACTQPGWRATARIGQGGIWVRARAARLESACETPEGFLILYDPRNLGGGRQIDDLRVYDIVPTLLSMLGQPVPARLGGDVLTGL